MAIMKPIAIIAFIVCLVSACADLADPTGPGGTSGGPPAFCPDAADFYAQANGLPLPYPANPANPTPYSPELPPPAFFHPCRNASEAPTSRGGLPCMICTDGTDQYPDLLPGSLACTNEDANGNPIVCVGSLRAGDVTECDPGSQGCS